MRRSVARVGGVIAAITVLVLVLGLMGGGPDAPAHMAYLPLIAGSPAGCGELAIYDLDGQPQDWAWLQATFGAVVLERGDGSACVSELRAIEGPATLVVDVGAPGVPVVFYWPGSPELAEEMRACGLTQGLVVMSEGDGTADFAMGGGSYYWPPEGGPHVAWVPVSSGIPDCLRGLGMVGLTNHLHLDSVWR